MLILLRYSLNINNNIIGITNIKIKNILKTIRKLKKTGCKRFKERGTERREEKKEKEDI
jgi:hypothetical protein